MFHFFLASISIGLEAPIKMTSGDTAEEAEEMKPLPERLKPKFSKEQSLDFSEGYGSMGGIDSMSVISAFQVSVLPPSVLPTPSYTTMVPLADLGFPRGRQPQGSKLLFSQIFMKLHKN